MNSIQCITYPRSGHGLLVNILLRYFAANTRQRIIDSVEICQDVIGAGAFFYCEYYNHCRTRPCSNPRVNFQKNHDFGLRLPIDQEYYVIQYRHPLESITSWYRFSLDNNLFPDSEKKWQEFALSKISFWKDFVNKWLIGIRHSHIVKVSYAELVSDPKESASRVIEFISPETSVDRQLLHNVISSLRVCRKNRIIDFFYYDKDFFLSLERKVSREIELLGLQQFVGEQ